uniref:Secreted protein n=1 Tax=Steinernema glaseri TaxID=37863 RepID=A0A1I7Z536_9BILA
MFHQSAVFKSIVSKQLIGSLVVIVAVNLIGTTGCGSIDHTPRYIVFFDMRTCTYISVMWRLTSDPQTVEVFCTVYF